MIDGPVTFTVAPAGGIFALDLWTGALPELGVRTLRVEPRRWWLLDADAAAVIAQVGDRGAVAAIGGGLVHAVLAGPGWRSLLMISGLFDAENPAFGPGDVAATVIHHVPVWIAPRTADACDVWFAASHAPDLVALWTTSIAVSGQGDAG